MIFGHLDSFTGPAVFWRLQTLKPGDEVQVSYRNGKQLRFRVIWQHLYLNSHVPSTWLVHPVRQRSLALITCAGVFHRDGTGYDHKLLVYARLILPGGRLG
jgi:hypothetical protein